MWLTPWRSRTSRVSSATFCETRPSAAAPKMTLVLLFPVRPNRAFGITRPTYTASGRPARARLDRVLWVGVSSIYEEAAVEFFNLKTKRKVEIPDNQLKKKRSVRTTSGGKRQERYAVIAEVHEGGKPLQLYKFVNKETFDRLDVPEAH